MSSTARAKLYLKNTCPFCLKLRIFLTDARIADRFDFVVFADGDDTHKALRQRMEAAGQSPSFPAAEIQQGTLVTGTDDLIARFAKEADIDPAALPLLAYYSKGVFTKYGEMFRELRQLKSG
jgi:glutaredoxin